MKKIILILPLALATIMVWGQSMKWIPANASSTGSHSRDQQCYSLEYVPSVNGVLTSYTTGFHVTCTSRGSAVTENRSTSMTANVRLLDGCSEYGVVLMNSSGHSGNVTNMDVKTGTPVILHQVCFTIPPGESITIRQDAGMGLTTSLDLAEGVYHTEYIPFAEQTFHSHVALAETPDRMPVLDFTAGQAGDHIAQLDWTASPDLPASGAGAQFHIERSADGVAFEWIGSSSVHTEPGTLPAYRHIDREAATGDNYYRIVIYDRWGNPVYSPVRRVRFEERPFTASFTPNPANDHILVSFDGTSAPVTEIRLFDFNGAEALQVRPGEGAVQSRLDVSRLRGGIYTLSVITATGERYTDKVVILR